MNWPVGGGGNINNNCYFLKTWKCTLCQFVNDSLKIVCINCRAIKQQQSQPLIKQIIPAKRHRQLTNTMDMRLSLSGNKPNRCQNLNDENELMDDFKRQSALKDVESKYDDSAKRAKYCSNCSCSNCKNSKEELGERNVTFSQLVTPVKPDDFYKFPSSSSSLFKVPSTPSTPKSVSNIDPTQRPTHEITNRYLFMYKYLN